MLLDSFLLASASEPPAVDVIHYGRAAAAELGIDLRRHADAIAEALHAPEPERTRLASKVVSNVLRLSGDELRERLRVFGALSHGAYSYRPSSPLRAPIHMLSPRPERAIESWNGALGRPTSATVPGDHYSMLQAPNVLATAEAMRCFVTVAGRRGVDHRRRLSASGSYAVDS